MTDQELKDLVASLAIGNQEVKEAQLKTEQAQLKTEQAQQETDRMLKELGKQIGGLNRKWGSFTEGMAFPSMAQLLEKHFHMDVISQNAKAHKGGRTLELDVFAYANTRINEVYIVEVKSHLRWDDLDQMTRILKDFHEFFPVHQDKKVYGILASVSAKESVKTHIRNAGIYVAHIHGDLFELEESPDFQAKAF